MSLLTRKGTMVRSNRPGSIKRSIKRKPRKAEASVPPPPLSVRDRPPQGSPARSVASTVISFNDERRLVSTTAEWRTRSNQGNSDQDTVYGSILAQIKEANYESTTICQFLNKSSKIICHTVFITILVGISLTLPIAMMFIGLKYIHDCPVNKSIPVYLLVGGCFGVVKIMGTVWQNVQYRRNLDLNYDTFYQDGIYVSHTYKLVDIALSLFLIGWLITGTYWVFSVWKPPFSQPLHEPSNWCDKTVYMFAVYQIIGAYSFLGLLILIAFVLTIYHKKSKPFIV